MFFVFFFKQKTAYEMRISDWSSDVCSSDLAVTPVPDTLSEYHFAGLLRGRKVELVDCKTQPLKVPAEAEIVIEGEVSLEDTAEEGPYGDHTGYYNAVERFPVFTVTAITMRRDPIYLSTFTGRPPDEPSVLGEALNEVFIPLLRQQIGRSSGRARVCQDE